MRLKFIEVKREDERRQNILKMGSNRGEERREGRVKEKHK